MNIIINPPEELEIVIEIPRFIIWLMAGPIAVLGSLFTLALLLGGEFVNFLVTALVSAALVLGGWYSLTKCACLWLNAKENTVRSLRTRILDVRRNEFPLEYVASAEVQQSQRNERPAPT